MRVVQPVDSATSRLENGFWKTGSGFSPLLASMGAAAMSFTPTRHALIAEGAGDAILLPTLLRQACELQRLAFQVAPGLSSVAAAAVGDLEAEAGRVAFLVDGDDGGRAIATKLVGAGVDADRIITLADQQTLEQLEVEDLVDDEVYTEAVNEELRCWQEMKKEVTADQVRGPLRTKSVEAWCLSAGVTAPDKTAVAQRIVDEGANRQVFAADRRTTLEWLLRSAYERLRISAET